MERSEAKSPSDDIRADQVLEQIERILRHPDFSATPQRRAFLTFIVDETLAGRAARLKGVAIALSVFGRDETFDQQTDPVVRLEARRLRHDLDNYYAGPGISDPIRVSIPKGSYVPHFQRSPSFMDASQSVIDIEVPHQRRWMAPGMIVLCLALLSVAAWVLFDRDNRTSQQEDGQSFPTGPIIAVLPFEMLGEGQPYVADGLTQQLTTELVRFRDLWVLPLGSVGRFREEQIDLQALKAEFGADYALEGNVTLAAEDMTISARLINLNTGRYDWVTSLKTGLNPAEIYDAQNTITHEIVGNLAGKYGLLSQSAMDVAKRRPPEHRDAYDCVLRYFAFQITIRLSQHADVVACIEQAVLLDPEYAEAWSILSNLYLQKVRYGLSTNPEIIPAAEKAARRAIELDPHSAYGQLMFANMLHTLGNIEGFKTAGNTALELNPNSVPVLAHYGMRLAFTGEWEDGLYLVDKAIKLNPVHPDWYYFPEVFHSYLNGNYDDALFALDKIDMPGFFWEPLIRAAVHGQMGNRTEANAAVDDLLRLKPEFAAQAAGLLSIWQFEDRFNVSVVEGLQKAGLDILY